MNGRQDGQGGFAPAANNPPARAQRWWKAPRKAPVTPLPGLTRTVLMDTIPQSKWRQFLRSIRQAPERLAERLCAALVSRRAAFVTAGGLLAAAAGVYCVSFISRQPQDRALTAGLGAWLPAAGASASAQLPEASRGVSVPLGRFVGEPGSRVTDLESMGSSELVKGAPGLRPSDGGLTAAFVPDSQRAAGSGAPAPEPAASGRSRSWADAISSAAKGISAGAKAAAEKGRRYSGSASLSLKGLMRGMGALSGASYRASTDYTPKAPELPAPRPDAMLSRSVVQTTLGLADSRAPQAGSRMRNAKSGVSALTERGLQPRALLPGGATLAASAAEAMPAKTMMDASPTERGVSASAADMSPRATERKKISDSESLSQQPPETAAQYAQKTAVQECIRFHYDRQRLALQESIVNQKASKPAADLSIPKECGASPDSPKLMLGSEQRLESERFMGSVTRPLLAQARSLLPAAMLDAEAARQLAKELDGRLAAAQDSVPSGPVGQTLAKARSSLKGSGSDRGVLGGLADFEAKAIDALPLSASAAPTCSNGADRLLTAATGRWTSAFDSLLGASETAQTTRESMPQALETITGRSAGETAVARQAAEDIRRVLGDPAFGRLAKDEDPDPKLRAVLPLAVAAQRSLSAIRNAVFSQSKIPFSAANYLTPTYQAAAEGGALVVSSLDALSGPEAGSRARLRDAVVGAVRSGASRCEAARALYDLEKSAGLSASNYR